MNNKTTTRPTRASAIGQGNGRFPSEYKQEGNGYGYEDQQQYANGTPSAPSSRIDITKLKMPALRKYSKVYDLPVHQSSTKDELTTVVANHWNTMVVTEESTLQNLMRVRNRTS